MEKKAISVFCDNENKQVGILELFPGENLLTNSIFLGSFVPVSHEYTIAGGKLKAGAYALCPRCGGRLCLVNDSKTEDAELTKLRNEARARAKAIAMGITSGPKGQNLVSPVGNVVESRTAESNLSEIVLSKTKVIVQ